MSDKKTVTIHAYKHDETIYLNADQLALAFYKWGLTQAAKEVERFRNELAKVIDG